MDKNSAIGLTLILLIFLGFNYMNMPTEEERAEAMRIQDSIAVVEEQNARLNETAIKEAVEGSTTIQEVETPETIAQDSASLAEYKNQFGEFGDASTGEDGTVVIENDLLAITVNNKGGHPLSVQLKGYQTSDSLPLLLFKGEQNRFSLDFFAKNNRVSTQELYFEPSSDGFSVSGENSRSLTMRLPAGPEQYIEYVYTLTGGSYLVDFDINFVGMQNVIERNATTLDLHWRNDLPHQEKSLQNERDNSTIYYRFSDDEVDYISERSDDIEEIKTDLQWVGFKQQFFSSVLINKDRWEGQSDLETSHDEESTEI
ncbi:MAG: YidC/Oxa1 family membrane protein insertase, partial [Bacteroidia bacterium]